MMVHRPPRMALYDSGIMKREGWWLLLRHHDSTTGIITCTSEQMVPEMVSHKPAMLQQQSRGLRGKHRVTGGKAGRLDLCCRFLLPCPL